MNFKKLLKLMVLCMMSVVITAMAPSLFGKTVSAAETQDEDNIVTVNNGKKMNVTVGEKTTIYLTGASDETKAVWSISKKKGYQKYTSTAKISKTKDTSVKVKGLNPGTCYVRANVDGMIYTCKVVVKAAEGTDISANQRTTTKAGKKASYTQEELDMLARVINGEAGSSWISNKEQRAVGSVVLNRVKSKRFPNTLRGVIYQRSQYACVRDGNYNRKPSKRAIANAKYLLENGPTLPSNVVFQAQFIQGRGVHTKIGNHYFCYI